MKITGSVQGEAARRYPGFTYRLPIMQRIDIWSVDPNRLHPTQEYPRAVGKPDQPYTQTIDRADYEIIVKGPGDFGSCPVELWMVPHKTYTDAKTRQMVYISMVSQVGWSSRTITDRILSRAFGALEQHHMTSSEQAVMQDALFASAEEQKS